MKQRMRGFTMVELLVTVALLGLLTALSVTALGPLRDRYNRRQAAELTASAAARAQLLSRETGRCHTLEVYTVDSGGNVSKAAVGVPGALLRIQRHMTADCHTTPTPATELEHVEWVRMPGRMRVRVETGNPEAEWRPNSRLRNGTTQLRVAVNSTSPALAIRLMEQGPVCVSEVPASGTLENCP
jgi:prepilin-type N-terminal cleavage/methylation domain-containing protein